MEWTELLAQPVLIVSGKGGTGKSTVAAALAMAGAAAGRGTLLVEVEGRGEAARTLGVPDPGPEERSTEFGFRHVSLAPPEAAVEYLRRYGGGIDRLTRPLLRTGVLEQVIGGAPGFRDLLLTGKLFEIDHVRRTDHRDRGRPLYDLVVVDGPPTGQIAGFLSAAGTFAELIRVGPLKRRATHVAEFLRRRTRLVLVCVPEEMAVAETLEAIPGVGPTGVRVAAMVLNRTRPPAFEPGIRAAARTMDGRRLVELAGAEGLSLDEGRAAELLAEASAADQRHRRRLAFRQQLARAGPVLELPDIPGNAPIDIVSALGRTIGGSPAPATKTAARRLMTSRPPEVERSLSTHLEGARIVIVCGSGGVGKTSVSAAVAVRSAAAGTRTALLTVDPARRLATALRLPMIPGERTTVGVGGGHRLEATQLDTQRTFDQLIRRYAGNRERQERILTNAFYRRIADTLSGTHEYMAMEKLYELAQEDDHELIMVDTPPTRSALSFLEAPNRLTDFLGGRFLRFMLWPTARAGRLTISATRFGASAFLRTAGRLVGAEALADTIDFLASFEGMYAGFKERAADVLALLRSPTCAFVVVTSPAESSLDEAGYFISRLTAAGMRSAAVVVNRWHVGSGPLPAGALRAARRLKRGDPERRAAAEAIGEWLREEPRRATEFQAVAGFAAAHPGVPLLAVPELSGDVQDVAGLRRVAGHLFDPEPSTGDIAGEAAR